VIPQYYAKHDVMNDENIEQYKHVNDDDDDDDDDVKRVKRVMSIDTLYRNVPSKTFFDGTL